MTSLRLILKLIPWALLILALLWIGFTNGFGIDRIKGSQETYQNTLLTKVEQIGKLELAKYNFQEVTEIKRVADVVDLKFFKYKIAPDSKAVLISQGSATGCLDLGQLTSEDIRIEGDTLFVALPNPEICYFKIDLEKSRLYDLQINTISLLLNEHNSFKNFIRLPKQIFKKPPCKQVSWNKPMRMLGWF